MIYYINPNIVSTAGKYVHLTFVSTSLTAAYAIIAYQQSYATAERKTHETLANL